MRGARHPPGWLCPRPGGAAPAVIWHLLFAKPCAFGQSEGWDQARESLGCNPMCSGGQQGYGDGQAPQGRGCLGTLQHPRAALPGAVMLVGASGCCRGQGMVP